MRKVNKKKLLAAVTACKLLTCEDDMGNQKGGASESHQSYVCYQKLDWKQPLVLGVEELGNIPIPVCDQVKIILY